MKQKTKAKAGRTPKNKNSAPQKTADRKPGKNKVNAALLKELEKYRGLAEASFEAIAIHDQGKILATNQAAANIFGYPISELVGKSILNFVTPDSIPKIRESMASNQGSV